ncbi:MAG: LpxD N-terminal domain-containing protein, partial [Burkholderiales bacterium]
MALTLGEIVAVLAGELHGDPALAIEGLAPLASAGPGQLAFLSNPTYRPQLDASRAACVIVGPAVRDAAVARGACIVTDDPYAYFARVTQLWKRTHGRCAPTGIHPSAVVDPEAVLGEGVTIGPHCVVERGARIGAGTVLKAR